MASPQLLVGLSVAAATAVKRIPGTCPKRGGQPLLNIASVVYAMGLRHAEGPPERLSRRKPCLTASPTIDTRAVESLLAFWADAGVDAAYEEAPVDRLSEGARRLQPPARPAAPRAPTQPSRSGAAGDPAGAVAEARAVAAAAGDLIELEAAIVAFDGCPLKFSGATRAVFARGAPNGPVMLIGEAPGAEEDSQGAPFVGRAGRLLDAMLRAAGLEDRVFITNTVFWRPPGNSNPSPQDQAVCAPLLQRAIQLVQPKVLLLVGAAAAKSLLRRPEGILSLRGKWFEWTDDDESLTVPVLATLHPAFLLRQPGAKKKAWADLLTLTGKLDRGV
jgi:DNA polymerase